jgi:hypothetical protein
MATMTDIVERLKVWPEKPDMDPAAALLAEAAAEIERLRAVTEAAPRPVVTELVKKLETWKQAWGTDATTGLLDTAVAEIEALRAERDWARSEFERAMVALDSSITGVEWKWDGRRPGSLLVCHYSKPPSRQQKQHILKDVEAKGRIKHRRKRRRK